jgi:hypothetical protein
MKKISLDDLMDLSAYEKVRSQFRQEIIRLKKNRRLPVGDRVSLVFENRQTVIFQIQEMVRAEKITNLDKIKEEVDVYNTLIPNSNELSATMFLEIEDQANIRRALTELIGVDGAISMHLGSDRIAGEAEAGRKTEEKISSVQYIRFRFSPVQKKTFLAGSDEVSIVSEHPNYRHHARIPENLRISLAEDLLSE